MPLTYHCHAYAFTRSCWVLNLRNIRISASEEGPIILCFAINTVSLTMDKYSVDGLEYFNGDLQLMTVKKEKQQVY